jgi:hypothetical protein
LLNCCSLADAETSKALIDLNRKEGNMDAVVDVLRGMARGGLLPSRGWIVLRRYLCSICGVLNLHDGHRSLWSTSWIMPTLQWIMMVLSSLHGRTECWKLSGREFRGSISLPFNAKRLIWKLSCFPRQPSSCCRVMRIEQLIDLILIFQLLPC